MFWLLGGGLGVAVAEHTMVVFLVAGYLYIAVLALLFFDKHIYHSDCRTKVGHRFS